MLIDFTDLGVLGSQIQTLEEVYKETSEFELVKWLRAAPNYELRLTESVIVDCYNRAYPFTVKKLKLRSKNDTSVMIVGEYFGKDDKMEFFTSIWNFKQMKRIVDQII